jgi:anti-anti-sigma regulatory factor
MALRITVEEDARSLVIKLEGRLVGPWAAELDRLWDKTSPNLAARPLSLDLREITFADSGGIRALRAIYIQTEAAILTSTPWTEYLADEVTRRSEKPLDPEV